VVKEVVKEEVVNAEVVKEIERSSAEVRKNVAEMHNKMSGTSSRM
jgi:hypothetical protein